MQKLLYKLFSVLIIAALLLALLPAGAVKADDPLPSCKTDGDECFIQGRIGNSLDHGWEGFEVHFTIGGHEPTAGEVPETYPMASPAITNSDGIFTITGKYGDQVSVMPDGNFMDGYNCATTYGTEYMWNNQPGILGGCTGQRNANGHIGGVGSCRANAKITLTHPFSDPKDALADHVTYSNGEGDYNANNLEPVTYTVIPSKGNCTFPATGDITDTVYTPANRPADVTSEDAHDLNFDVQRVTLMGRVHLAQPYENEPMAPGLIASYYIANDPTATAYQASINWADGNFGIENIPANLGGKLIISRTGGATAFGYSSNDVYDAAKNPLGTGGWKVSMPKMVNPQTWQDITLTGARVISGTIAGQNGVPFGRDTSVSFGGGLNWVQPWVVGAAGNGSAFSIFAQPKLYYLAPLQDGIRGVTPTRALANLTAAATAAVGAFTVTLQDRDVRGCIQTDNNEPPVLANFTGGTAPVRLKAAVGTVPYYYALMNPDWVSCDNGRASYALWPVPYGIFGTLEINNHTSRQTTTLEPQIFDRNNWYDLRLYGDRTLSGKIAASSLPNVLSPNVRFDDYKNWDNIFRLQYKDETNPGINAYVDMNSTNEFDDQTREFKIFTLERHKYRLVLLNGGANGIQGFTITPSGSIPSCGTTYPNPCLVDNYTVQVDLTAADKDLGTLFSATHLPIITGIKTSANGPGNFKLEWNKPVYNNDDKPWWYQVQIVPASGGYPAPETAAVGVDGSDGKGGMHSDPISYGTSGKDSNGNAINPAIPYKWHVRASFDKDFGAWTADQFTYSAPSSATVAVVGANANFTITDDNSSLPSVSRYLVQYCTTAACPTDFPAPSATNTWLSATLPLGIPFSQPIGTLPNGVYKWRTRIVVGAAFATIYPITDWTDGSPNIIK